MGALFNLTDKVAIVTGGANGIGRAVVEVFALQGAIVHFIDIDNAGGLKLEDELSKDGYLIHFHHCDVSHHEQLGRVFDAVREQSGGLDILINNAGVSSIGTV